MEGTPATPAAARPAGPTKINLALQGGGSHRAFTRGVLLRLLEEAPVEVEAISGSSAGALSGAALTSPARTSPGRSGTSIQGSTR